MQSPGLITGNPKVVWEPQPGPQTALLTCPVQDILFGGARGGGKTDGLLGDFLGHADTWGANASGILLRRSNPELEDIEKRSDELYPLIGAEYLITKRTWVFPNGARLKFRHLDNDKDAGKRQGHAYTWIGVDEAGNFPSADPIDKLRGTLRSVKGVRCDLRLSANPGGPGHVWLKKAYVDPSPPMVPFPDPRSGLLRVYIPSRLENNPLLMQKDPDYINRLKSTGEPWLVAAWLKGDWNATKAGGIIDPAWFKRYSVLPCQGEIVRVVQSWDTAQKDKQVNDPSCCTTWIETRLAYYLVHVFVKKMKYPDLKRAIKSLAEQFSPNVIVIEDKSSGTSVLQDLLDETTLPVVGYQPGTKDKVMRLLSVSGHFESGRVNLPDSAPWLMDYEHELTTFPETVNDDQVDSTSQALAYMINTSGKLFYIPANIKRSYSHAAGFV